MDDEQTICSERLHVSIQISIFFALLTFVTSSITNNISQVDKLWSILPVIYSWLFLLSLNDKKQIIMTLLVSIWGIRLTWNFNRRGGYSFYKPWDGDEDYRWCHVRKFISNQILWIIFNFTFVSCYQIFLLWALVVPPSYIVCQENRSSSAVNSSISSSSIRTGTLTLLDGIISTFFIFCVVIESIADNEQWAFQTKKYSLPEKERTKDHKDGFCQSGLFAIVRKPNYAAEQLIWILFYFFSVGSSQQYVNISVTGCVLLVLLFQGSAWLTEKLSCEKYPKYELYMKQVPLFIPSFESIFFKRKDS